MHVPQSIRTRSQENKEASEDLVESRLLSVLLGLRQHILRAVAPESTDAYQVSYRDLNFTAGYGAVIIRGKSSSHRMHAFRRRHSEHRVPRIGRTVENSEVEIDERGEEKWRNLYGVRYRCTPTEVQRCTGRRYATITIEKPVGLEQALGPSARPGQLPFSVRGIIRQGRSQPGEAAGE